MAGCIHGGDPKYCRICVKKKEAEILLRSAHQNGKRTQMIEFALDDFIDGFIETHGGSYFRGGQFYNVHIKKTKLINALTKFIINHDNQNTSPGKHKTTIRT